MTADWHINRRDAEDDHRDAREVYIAEQTAALLAEYQADDEMTRKAVDEYMAFHDTEDLCRALRTFSCAYRNAATDRGIAEVANVLAEDLQRYTTPILREWAHDKVLADLEQAASNQSEARDAA